MVDVTGMVILYALWIAFAVIVLRRRGPGLGSAWDARYQRERREKRGQGRR